MVLNPGTVNQRVHEFDEKHGGLALAIAHETILYWPDGAYREINKLGVLADNQPLDNDVLQTQKNQRYRLFYAKLKLEQGISLFEHLQKNLIKRTEEASQSDTIPPSENELDELKALRKEVMKWQSECESVEAEMNPPRPPDSPEIIRTKAKNRAKTQAFRKRLDAIEV